MQINSISAPQRKHAPQQNFKRHIKIAIPLAELAKPASSSASDLNKFKDLTKVDKIFSALGKPFWKPVFVAQHTAAVDTSTHRIMGIYLDDRVDLKAIFAAKPKLIKLFKEQLSIINAAKAFGIKPDETRVLTKPNKEIDDILINLATHNEFDNMQKIATDAAIEHSAKAIIVETRQKSTQKEFLLDYTAFEKNYS